MSSLTEMNEALRRQASYGLWIPAANGNRPRVGPVAALVRTIRRRHTANLLRQLDSRLLDDIGITRGDIDAVAAKAAARKGAPAMPAMPGVSSLARLPASIVTALTKAWRRQAAIVGLQRLSNHTLADIGIVRGCIPEIVDAMMAQDTATATRVPATVTAKVTTAKPVEIAVPAQQAAA